MDAWIAAAAAVAAGLFAWLSWKEARRANRIAAETARRYTPGWRLYRGEHAFLLVNESPETAFDVQIRITPGHVTDGKLEHGEITPFSAVVFRWETDETVDWDSAVTVTWHRRVDGRDETLTWTHPMIWAYEVPPGSPYGFGSVA